MAVFELRLLGGFRARAGGRRIDVPGRKERALLAYLAVTAGEARSREQLCELLWGDKSQKQARDSLKQAIYRLRSSFGPTHPLPLIADRSSLTLDGTLVAVDVKQFEMAVSDVTTHAVEFAASLYRGDFLDGLEIRDAVFENWQLFERRRLRELLIQALSSLLERYASDADHDRTGPVAHKLLALDPLEEAAHRALMRRYADQGQRALALRQYEVCREILEAELGVAPDSETEQLYQSIKTEGVWSVANPSVPGAVGLGSTDTSLRSRGPRIEVAAFVNSTGDPGLQHIADGLTEDVITELTRWGAFTVTRSDFSLPQADKVANRHSGGFEGQPSFLVRCSLRRQSGRQRITAHLIEAETRNLVWAERFDRPESDTQSADDSLIRTLVAALAGRVQISEVRRVRHTAHSGRSAYELTLLGNSLSWDDAAAAAEAKFIFQKAIETDRGYGHSYGLLATMLGREWRNNPVASRGLLERGLALAERGVDIAEDDATCQTALGYILLERRDFELAMRHMEMAIEINSANPWIWADLGYLYSYLGRAEEAVRLLDSARRLDPHLGPPWYWRCLGVAQFALGRYADAMAAFDRGARNSPRYTRAMMAGCCARLGDYDGARKLVSRCIEGATEDGIARLLTRVPFRRASDQKHLAHCLRLAGLHWS